MIIVAVRSSKILLYEKLRAESMNLFATFIMLILEYKLPLNKTLKKDKLIPKKFSYL
ncbi:hypothetical protein bcgnr5380_10750 [Bacillus cereus]